MARKTRTSSLANLCKSLACIGQVGCERLQGAQGAAQRAQRGKAHQRIFMLQPMSQRNLRKVHQPSLSHLVFQLM